jgi:hypothetical protein
MSYFIYGVPSNSYEVPGGAGANPMSYLVHDVPTDSYTVPDGEYSMSFRLDAVPTDYDVLSYVG